MEGNSDKLGKYARQGKYIVTEKYPEPHRDKNGKIIIENGLLYEEDCRKYNSYQAEKWARQGKYNLTPEEFEKEKERIQKSFEYLHHLSGR